MNGRLTLSPGVRFELNRGSVPAQPDVFRTNTIAPRIGLAWDLGPDHRTVARVHYGHYYDPIFASRIMAEDSTDDQPWFYYQFEPPDQWVEINRFVPQDNFAIDPDLEHSHVKQLVVGLEREVLADVSLQAQYIRRRFDTYMGLIDTGSIYVPTQRPDPGRTAYSALVDDAGMIDVFDLTNPGKAFYVYTNPEDAFNKYDAVQVVARKRYSRNWQLQASYTWSKNRGTVGNRWHVNAARFDLGNPGNFVNPNWFINAYGRALFDPTHEAKVLGSYRLPWWGGTMVSGVYRYTTGQAWGRVAAYHGACAGWPERPGRAAGHPAGRRPQPSRLPPGEDRPPAGHRGDARPLLRRLQPLQPGRAGFGRGQRSDSGLRRAFWRAERLERFADAARGREGRVLNARRTLAEEEVASVS